MPLAFAFLGAAVLFVISGLKGGTIADAFAGRLTDPLDPKGGAGAQPLDLSGATPTGNSVAEGLAATAQSGDKVGRLKRAMDRMAAVGKPYMWAGGHAGFSHDGPWDCSGAVSQALHEAGFDIKFPLVSTAFMAWGKPGPGKRVTIAANPSHVFLIVDGQTWTTVSSGSSPKWTGHTTHGFVLRHPEGY